MTAGLLPGEGLWGLPGPSVAGACRPGAGGLGCNVSTLCGGRNDSVSSQGPGQGQIIAWRVWKQCLVWIKARGREGGGEWEGGKDGTLVGRAVGPKCGKGTDQKEGCGALPALPTPVPVCQDHVKGSTSSLSPTPRTSVITALAGGRGENYWAENQVKAKAKPSGS